MSAIQHLITEHLDIWTAADAGPKSGRGRSSANSAKVYGISKLRELILELAVRGKLVPQNASDEPASALIKRIQAEKAQLIAEGKIKKEKPLAPITEEEKPFEAPLGWEWSSVYTLTLLITDGTHHTPKYQDSGIPFISVKDINGSTISFDDCKYISQEEHEDINARCNPERDDILLCRIGTLGRPTIVDTDRAFSLFVSVGLLKLPKSVKFSRYMHVALSSPLMYSQYNQIKAGGSHTNKLNLGDIPRLIVPVPPIAEQHRIVAKVDELMALCDQLESEHNNATDAHEKLVSHLLGTLTQSQSAEDFSANWQRIATHFDTLFTTEASIDALKQALLQLAVMGKLVPQDPNDEPASELLGRIQVEKAKLVAEGKIKKGRLLAGIADDEKKFELPAGWEWIRKTDIFTFLNGYAFKSEWFKPEGVKLLRNINVSHGFANWDDCACVSEEHAAEFEDFRLSVGDMVLSLDRPIITTGLKFAVISESDIPCLLLQRVAKIVSVADGVSSGYLSIWLNSSFFVGEIDPGRSNGVPHISTTQVANMVFALPPAAEQHRIVAKVDELMTLCDQLKSRLTESSQLQQALANVLIEKAVA